MMSDRADPAHTHNQPTLTYLLLSQADRRRERTGEPMNEPPIFPSSLPDPNKERKMEMNESRVGSAYVLIYFHHPNGID